MSEKRLSSLQLPKIFNNRSIRIKSRDRSNKNKRSLTGRNFKTLSNDKCRKSTSQQHQTKMEETIQENEHIQTQTKNCIALFEKNYQQGITQLQRIAKLFDPNNLLNMKGKKQNRGTNKKINVMMFQKKKKKQKPDADEYWKKVNESMILASCRNEQYISKDLQEIMQTFVTE